MPRYDGTGPAGQGPMTGRGQGPCNNYCAGCGRRLGLGKLGFRFPRQEPLDKQEQKKLLETELDAVRADLDAINKELDK